MGWLPIDPRLDEGTGAFACFSGMQNARELKPAAYHGEALQSFYGREDGITMRVAATLGVMPAVDVATEYDSWVLTYDAMMFAETNASPPNGGLIFATRWGAGFRMMLQVWSLQAKVGLSLVAVAASAELGLVDASYQIVGFGFTDPALLGLLPGPGRFDRANCKRILDAGNAIQERLRTRAAEPGIAPVPFQVLMATPPLDAPLATAQATVLAMRHIAQGSSLAEALAAENAAQLDAATIRSTYAAMVKDASGGPSGGEREHAIAWLRFERS